MARGSDQCVWSVCVVSKCCRLVWSLGGALGDVISGSVCLSLVTCILTLFSYLFSGTSHSIIILTSHTFFS